MIKKKSIFSIILIFAIMILATSCGNDKILEKSIKESQDFKEYEKYIESSFESTGFGNDYEIKGNKIILDVELLEMTNGNKEVLETNVDDLLKAVKQVTKDNEKGYANMIKEFQKDLNVEDVTIKINFRNDGKKEYSIKFDETGIV